MGHASIMPLLIDRLSLEHDGVPHDPFAKHCSSKDGYVMADLIPKGSNTFLWSTCSKAKLQQFLRQVTV